MNPAPALTRIELLHPLVAEILRKKTPTERVAMALESNRLVRERLTAQLRREHPEWSEADIAGEVGRRLLGGAR
jgi:hypothetical protein